MSFQGLKVGLVGPLPPPSGGMANQTRQLGELLQREGAAVTIVQVNADYGFRPAARIRGIRALVRLLPYVARLWRVAGRVEILHVMANSGWSWHLFAAPAIWTARLRGIPSIVNYRGGEAASFLARSPHAVRCTLRCANALVLPSAFLREVFAARGIRGEVVPNIIDLERFRPADAPDRPDRPHILVARNLEPIYDIPTALRAFRIVRDVIPGATLTVAGSGPERARLAALATELGIADAVDFCGRVDRDRMASLFRSAAVMVNPSRVDNMPNSVLEAMACGVPVVSTNVGGIPGLVQNEVTALLVESGNPAEIAAAIRRVLGDRELATRLREAGLREVQQYDWPHVRPQWAAVYASVRSGARIAMEPA